MYSRKSVIHSQIHYFVLLLIVFFFPMEKKIIPPLIIILSLNWLIEGNFRKKFTGIKHKGYALLFISLYLMHCIGLFYSENIDFAFLA